MTSTSYDPVCYAFDAAKREFQAQLKDPDLYDEILKTTTIDQVYDFTDRLQEEQAKNGHLRHLAKIEPYLEGLREYAKVIEVFAQVSPDILCLIWGPIKLLLQWSSALKKSFDEIILVTAAIGDILPQFKQMTRIFRSNESLKQLLVLFFKDILDFYHISFEFFTKKRWQYILEAIWPKCKAKLEIVVKHIQRHSMLMKGEVTMQRISEEQDARQRALDHYDDEACFRLRRDFDSNRARISPRMYCDKLNRLRETICDGTGEWLMKDAALVNWMDVANSSAKILWLQGIPGSGKTYLSATVVDKSLKMIYAFLSHVHNRTSAISILHTILFQLAEESDDIKVMVNASDLKELQGSTDYTMSIVVNALKVQGPTYIVIDGLDEIGELDRQILLLKLCAIAVDEPEVKLLVSSRNDHHINQILRSKAQTINVDGRNESCIQTYVRMRSRRWFQEAQFDQTAESEIRKLLTPIGNKAQGMFLYARIVLDNVEMLYDVEAIKNDLRALPKDLNEAYGRIFSRISDLPPTSCEQATKLLGWVGCSEKPLSTQELEQAILIAQGNSAPRVGGRLPVLKLCGPIIEVIDDKIQFVHFTVKEFVIRSLSDLTVRTVLNYNRYIFSKDIPGYIDLGVANTNLLMACLEHLSSSLFDDDQEEKEIQANILNGLYRFSSFATSQWPKLVMQHALYNHGQPAERDLVKLVEKFLKARENLTFHNDEDNILTKLDLEGLKKMWNVSYETLSRVLVFHFRSQQQEWRLSKVHSWQHNDPLTISSIIAQIRKQREEVVCVNGHHTGCHCHRLTGHYGKSHFHCDFLSCPSYLHGFPTSEQLKRHIDRHERQYKCPLEQCDYSIIGFITEIARDNHWGKFHQQSESERIDSNNLASTADEAALFDMVRVGDAEKVSLIMNHEATLISPDFHVELLKLAISSGSTHTIEALFDGEINNPARCLFLLEHAIHAKNMNLLNWRCITEAQNLPRHLPPSNGWPLCLGKPRASVGITSNWKKVNIAVMKSESSDIFALWVETLVARTPKLAFETTAWMNTSEFPEQELRLLALWKSLAASNSVNDKVLCIALLGVAQGCCSLAKGKTLVELGADVNFKNIMNGPTVLQYALRKTTCEAAQFIKFLLLQGADPETSTKNVHAKDELGAKDISKWLGMSFDELVEWAKAERNGHNVP